MQLMWSFLIVLAAVMAALPVRAQNLFDPSTLSGTAIAGAAAASGEKSWTDGGFGKLQAGNGDGQAGGIAIIAWRPNLSARLSLHVSGSAQLALRGVVGVDEVYLRIRREPSARLGVSGRAGLFFPLASLEHDGSDWTPHYTLTPSAIGSWIAEEVKVVGTEATIHAMVGSRRVNLTVAAFGANETAGALLAYRGWALHDVRATLGRSLPLPPLPLPVAATQSQRTQPLYALRGRIGAYAKADLEISDTLHLSAFAYANNGDRIALANGQYSWMTQFVTVGARWHPSSRTTIFAQGLTGVTQMGLTPDNMILFNIRFNAAYALIARNLGWGMLTTRADVFSIKDRSPKRSEDITEHGASALAAIAIPLTPGLDLVAEGIAVSSTRAARVRIGALPRQLTVQSRLALRKSF